MGLAAPSHLETLFLPSGVPDVPSVSHHCPTAAGVCVSTRSLPFTRAFFTGWDVLWEAPQPRTCSADSMGIFHHPHTGWYTYMCVHASGDNLSATQGAWVHLGWSPGRLWGPVRPLAGRTEELPVGWQARPSGRAGADFQAAVSVGGAHSGPGFGRTMVRCARSLHLSTLPPSDCTSATRS